MKRWALCLLLLLGALSATSCTLRPRYASCVILGDSLTEGFDLLPGQQPFSADLLALLRADDATNCASATVVGIGGFTAGNELVTLQREGINPPSPDLLVVEFGQNERGHGMPPLALIAEYFSLFAYLHRPLTLVCTSLWAPVVQPGIENVASREQYNAAISAACAGQASRVVDVDITSLYADPDYHGGPDMCCGDVFHPNHLGAQAIAAAIYAAL